MEYSESINSKIAEKDGKSLEFLFKFDSKRTREILSATRISDLIYPFNLVLPLYYKESYEECIEIVKIVKFDEEWAFPIYKHIIHRLCILSNLREDFGKVLVNIFRKFERKNDRIYFYSINALIAVYTANKKFNMIDSLISIIKEPKSICKEAIIYFYYLGINRLMRDDFLNGYLYLRKAFKYKFIEYEVAPALFISVILNRRKVKKPILLKYNVESKFVERVYAGTFRKEDLPTDLLIKHNLLRVCRLYFPLISHRNSIFRIYVAMRKDNKLETKYIEQKMNMEFYKCCSVIVNLIGQGYIKGYLSVNKRCLVLSKLNPFPSNDLKGGEELKR